MICETKNCMYVIQFSGCLENYEGEIILLSNYVHRDHVRSNISLHDSYMSSTKYKLEIKVLIILKYDHFINIHWSSYFLIYERDIFHQTISTNIKSDYLITLELCWNEGWVGGGGDVWTVQSPPVLTCDCITLAMGKSLLNSAAFLAATLVAAL